MNKQQLLPSPRSRNTRSGRKMREETSRKRERSLVCARLGRCGFCRCSAAQTKMRGSGWEGGGGGGVGRARVVANRHTDWASPVEAPLLWRRHKCYVSTPCDFKAADGCKYTCSTNFCAPGRSAWVTLGHEMSQWQKVQTGHMNS